jgi:hypothetical protein
MDHNGIHQQTPDTCSYELSERPNADLTPYLPAASRSLDSRLDSGSIASLFVGENGVPQRSIATGHKALSQPHPSTSSVGIGLWTIEMIASAFSISCIAAMVAVLKALDGQPYEPWKVFRANVTPNAVVAVLATGAKSSLLLAVASAIGQLKWTYFQQQHHKLIHIQTFDEASRGPLGSIQLLWHIRFQAIVAGLGAIITVLALGMEPLSQQLLSYPVALANGTDQVASIGAAYSFGDNSGRDASK